MYIINDSIALVFASMCVLILSLSTRYSWAVQRE